MKIILYNKEIPTGGPNEGGGPGGNATGKDLIQEKLTTTVWKILIGILSAVVIGTILLIIF
jgi:hypothetical protein